MQTIEFDHVTKVFADETVAVDDLNLLIEAAEFMVFVGPSGSGKSTALRMVAGLEEVSYGSIRIGARLVNDVPPKNRDIAMIFQSYALYPHMTVAENMAFSLTLQRVPKTERNARVVAAAQMLEIGNLLKRKPAELSGGQRQRVAMGRAIVREPQAFLMDEPLSNLDAKLRVQMRTEISALHQRLGRTTIYVTHDQTEAMTMGDRVAVLRDGNLEQVDRPKALYDSPANVFVAGFIGSPSMNLLPATLIAHGDGVSVVFGGTSLRVPPARIPKDLTLPRDVIVGIRPEDIEDAMFVSNNGSMLDVIALRAEPLGSEVVLHFESSVPAVVTGATLNLLQDVDAANGEMTATTRPALLTARLNPRTAAQDGAPVRLHLDPERLHFFDPDSERSLL